jgi:ribosome-associated protein
MLLDYGDVVVHIFETQMREFYDLEHLWGDAPRVKLPRREKQTKDDAE